MPTVTAIIALLTAAPASTAPNWNDASADLLPLAVTNGRTMDVASGDLNGDGHLDLVIAAEHAQNAVMLWNDGRFEYAPEALPLNVRHDSEDIAIADFDHDGDLDLFFVSEDDQTNEYYLNDGDAVFVASNELLPRAGTTGVTNAVVAGDVNGDGHLDLILGNSGQQLAPGNPNASGGQNVLLLNDSFGGFEHAHDALPRIQDRTQDLELADIDNDGDLDLLVANEDANRILINDGTGAFQDQTEDRLGFRSNEETREVGVGDLDGDGDLDLYFANVAWSGASPVDALLLNDGSGNFTQAKERLPNRNVFSLDADLVDIDLDGDLDVVLAQIAPPLGAPAAVLINDAGSFSEVSSLVPAYFKGHGIDVEVADFDGDGTPDIYASNAMSSDYLLSGFRGAE